MESAGTAAPSELMLNGVKYRARPLTYREIHEYEQWARDAYLEQVERAMRFLDEDARKPRREAAADIAMKLSMTATDAEAIEVMDSFSRSVEGMTRLTWLGIRREHPDVTLETIGNALADQAALEMAVSVFNRLNSPDAEGGTRGNGSAKKKQRVRR